ncbi:MAG TPA: hypothetical protein PLZ93_08285, partial [Nocardioides sp.]|nr:hypothetical protein [Nocardioides sp.]
MRSDPLPEQVTGYRAVALDLTTAVTVAEEDGVGNDDVDDQRQLRGTSRCSEVGCEDALDQGVGHDRPARAGVTSALGAVGCIQERFVDRDAVLDRQQRTEPGHHIRCRPQSGVPVRLGAGAACGDRHTT